MRARLAALALAATTLVSLVALVSPVAAATAEPMIGPGKTEVAGAWWPGPDLIAVAGGFDDSAAPTADFLLFDPATRAWSRGPDLPGVRDHAALVALDDHLYLVGGFTAGLAEPTASVWRLDTPAGEWTAVASMGTPRGALGAAAVSGRLFAVGGVDAAGRDLVSSESYDPHTDRWTPGPDLATTRQHVGVTARGQTLFAIGGRSPNLATVERLRVRRGSPVGGWRAAPRLTFSRSGNGAATAGGVVCTAGGEEAAGTIAPIECLRGGRWEHVADMRVPRHGLAVVAVGDELHMISGGPRPGYSFSVDHEVLTIDRGKTVS